MQQLGELGLLPPETRRVIIDLKIDDAVKIYVESFGTKTLEPILKQLLMEIKVSEHE